MRNALLCAVSAAFLLLISTTISAQSGPPAHPPRPKYVGPAKWMPSAQEVSAAYWTLEPGWNTTLEMRNNVTHHDLTVTPFLRSSTGQETALNPVTIPPQHVVAINLRDANKGNGGTVGSFGSVVFRFDGLYADNLFAATIVRREGAPIDFHFDGQQAGPTYNSGGIEGMWWIPAASSTDYLIFGNPLKKTVTGTLKISSSFASHRPIVVSLAPGETKRIDLRELLGPSSVGSLGGISLSLPGKELISATQIIFDEVTGLAAIMKMFDREPDDQSMSRVLRAPMMALAQPDPSLGFPNGTQLLPRIFLRNAGVSPAQVSASIDWRNQGSGTFSFPVLKLAPGEVTTVNLAEYEQSGQIPPDATWGTLKLAYRGRRADLVAVAISYDKDSRYGLQTPFSEDLSRLWAGGMWHVDATHNTLITTGNGGTEPTAAEVTLFYNGGKSKYRIEKILSPGQQLWIDLGHVVHDQVPDSDGNPLPLDTMSGSYELRDLDHATVGQLYEGKLVIDKTYGHAAYGCGSCCGYSGVVFDPTTFGAPPGIDNSDFIHANDTCSGTVDDVTGSAYNWGSNNTSVATLPDSTLHTVAVGTATGSTNVGLQWAHPPSCPNQIFGPTQSISVATVTISGSTSIPMLKAGTQGTDSTKLTATGSPSGGTYSWTALSGAGNITILNATSQTATIQSVAVGTYTVQVSYTINSKVATATTVGRVQQPGSLGVISNTTPLVACTNLPGSYNTYKRSIQYQVLDTSSPPTPIQVADMNLTETLNGISNTCKIPYPTPTVGAQSGDNGYFPLPDTLQLCSAVCLPANGNGNPTGSCSATVAQTWNVNGFAVKSDTLNFTCPGPPTGAP